jgi:hypothetical protein
MQLRRLRHRPAYLVAVLCLAAACSTGKSEPEPRADVTPTGASTTADAPTPVDHGAFCREYEKKVRLVYTVLSRRTASGRDLSITLTVHNGFERHLLGDIGGAMAVTARNPGSAPRYEWGDSPNDVVGVRALSTRRVLISNLGVKPLSVPAGAKVSVLGAWSRLGPSRTGREPCWLPADVRAEPGLVIGHPSGRWFLSVRRGQQLEKRADR